MAFPLSLFMVGLLRCWHALPHRRSRCRRFGVLWLHVDHFTARDLAGHFVLHEQHATARASRRRSRSANFCLLLKDRLPCQTPKRLGSLATNQCAHAARALAYSSSVTGSCPFRLRYSLKLASLNTRTTTLYPIVLASA